MKIRSKEYVDIKDYLAEEKRELTFKSKDIKIVKSKINEIHKINEFKTLKEQINELERIESDLKLVIELVEKNNDFALNTVFYIAMLGTLIASVDKVAEMFIEQYKFNYLPSILYAAGIIISFAFLIIFVIGKDIIFPENKLKRNRHVAIYVLGQMIQEKKEN